MRLDEGRNVIGKRVNRELGGIAGFRCSVTARFNGDSTETWVSRESFGCLARVSTQPVLEYYRQPISPASSTLRIGEPVRENLGEIAVMTLRAASVLYH